MCFGLTSEHSNQKDNWKWRCRYSEIIAVKYHCVKSVQIPSFFWSLFPCIRIEYRKIQTIKNSVFGHFLRSGRCTAQKVIFSVRFSLVKTTRTKLLFAINFSKFTKEIPNGKHLFCNNKYLCRLILSLYPMTFSIWRNEICNKFVMKKTSLFQK